MPTAEPTATPRLTSAPAGSYKENNGHRYQLITEKLTWTEAKLACEAAGGHLVTITSESENQFLLESFVGYDFWIGISDERQEGIWKWVTGEQLAYRNWGTNEPDNAPPKQDYGFFCSNECSGEADGVYWKCSPGQWDDMADFPQFYVCEWDADLAEIHEKNHLLNSGGEEKWLVADSAIRRMTVSECWKWSYEALGYIYHEILARHGYLFKSDSEYAWYFTEESWYQKIWTGNNGDVYVELNEVEMYNLELIKSVREQMAQSDDKNPNGFPAPTPSF